MSWNDLERLSNAYVCIIFAELGFAYLQDLKKEGARHVAIVGLSKIGCVPAIVTISPGDGPIIERPCNESLSLVAHKFNQKLLKLANSMNNNRFKVFYADIYKPFDDMVNSPSKYGEFYFSPSPIFFFKKKLMSLHENSILFFQDENLACKLRLQIILIVCYTLTVFHISMV